MKSLKVSMVKTDAREDLRLHHVFFERVMVAKKGAPREKGPLRAWVGPFQGYHHSLKKELIVYKLQTLACEDRC